MQNDLNSYLHVNILELRRTSVTGTAGKGTAAAKTKEPPSTGQASARKQSSKFWLHIFSFNSPQ